MRSLFKYCIVFTLILFGGCSKISEEDSIKFAISQNPQNLDPRYQSDAASERNMECSKVDIFLQKSERHKICMMM